jgi:hypothetical protein
VLVLRLLSGTVFAHKGGSFEGFCRKSALELMTSFGMFAQPLNEDARQLQDRRLYPESTDPEDSQEHTVLACQGRQRSGLPQRICQGCRSSVRGRPPSLAGNPAPVQVAHLLGERVVAESRSSRLIISEIHHDAAIFKKPVPVFRHFAGVGG